MDMLPRTYESLMPAIEEAGLQSPFDDGRVEQALYCLESVLIQTSAG